jgi:uncharacterized protein YneF (UPF0154 family)
MITIITAILIIGIIWGGFLFFLYRAIKFEKLKEPRENG